MQNILINRLTLTKRFCLAEGFKIGRTTSSNRLWQEEKRGRGREGGGAQGEEGKTRMKRKERGSRKTWVERDQKGGGIGEGGKLGFKLG